MEFLLFSEPVGIYSTVKVLQPSRIPEYFAENDAFKLVRNYIENTRCFSDFSAMQRYQESVISIPLKLLISVLNVLLGLHQR